MGNDDLTCGHRRLRISRYAQHAVSIGVEDERLPDAGFCHGVGCVNVDMPVQV